MRYDRILTRLIGTPLAISENKLEIITKNVTLNILQGKEIPSVKAFDGVDTSKSSSRLSTSNSPNVIMFSTPLLQRMP